MNLVWTSLCPRKELSCSQSTLNVSAAFYQLINVQHGCKPTADPWAWLFTNIVGVCSPDSHLFRPIS